MDTLQPLDYTAIAIYMLIMAAMGLSLGFFVKNVEDYFKGGSSIPWYMGGISNFMSLFSAFVFVAHAGIAYEHGLVALVVIWCAVPATIIGAIVFAKIWRRAGIISPVEFLEERFNSSVRQVFSWGGVGFRILDSMVRLYAIGVFVSTATPLRLDTAIWIAGLIVILYTVVGGLWAVILTDVVQFVVLITATLILVPLSITAVGGWEQLILDKPNHFRLWNGPKGEWSFLAVYYLMFAIKNNGNWAFIQRFYSVKDEKAGQKMGYLTALLFFIFPIVFLIPAIAGASLLPSLENGEMAYVSVALQLLPTGVMGIMLAAMFAATMSSLDSEYNVVASVITKDIYQRLFQLKADEASLMKVARFTTLLVGIIAILGALFVDRFGGAFEASKLFTSIFAIPLIIPVIFSVLIRKAHAQGAILSLVLGVTAGLILNFLPGVSWQFATFLTICVCIIAFLLPSLWSHRPIGEEKRIQAFFTRLSTPIPEIAKPEITPGFSRALLKLFVLALGGVGILIVAMSIPGRAENGGKLALVGGGICLMLAAILFFLIAKKKSVLDKPIKLNH